MRIQLFEFHDLPWYPRVWRQILTANVGLFARVFDIFHPIVPRLAHALRQCNSTTILDLCSGASGPLALLQRQLAVEEHCAVTVMLSDKFPDTDAFRHAVRASGGTLGFMESPVDATAVPPTLHGFRTMFNAFHHFDRVTAQKILQDAAATRSGIGVFEYTERSLVWYISALLSPLFFWLTGPFALQPVSATALIWIYLLPVPILFSVWDALVSCLRTYSPEALRALASAVEAPDYVWEVGRVRAFGGWYVTYLIGYPGTVRATSMNIHVSPVSR